MYMLVFYRHYITAYIKMKVVVKRTIWCLSLVILLTVQKRKTKFSKNSQYFILLQINLKESFETV